MSGIQTGPGKLRGLQAISTPQQMFTILALDHGASLAASLDSGTDSSSGYEQITAVKKNIITHLADHASAVLLDPVYGLAPAVFAGALPGHVGLLLAVEDGDYTSVEKKARLFAGWSVTQAKQAGAAAVKCFFYYHPDDEAVAGHQEAFVRSLVSDCAQNDIPLLAEPLSYQTPPASRRRVVIETARHISRLGIDVLKVEFPIDVQAQPDEDAWADACAELTAVCVAPWVLLSAGVDFDMFARQVQVACAAGASGYVAGRAIWKEGVTLTGAAQTAFWRHTAQPRLQQLAEIATTHGRPWTEYYPFTAQPPPAGWYQSVGTAKET